MTRSRYNEPAIAAPPLHALLLVLSLLAVEILPSLPRYFGLVSSLALGTAAAAGVVFFVYLVNWTTAFRMHVQHHGFVDFAVLAGAAIALLLLAPHAAIADSLQSIDVGRFFYSLALLTLFFGAALALGAVLARASEQEVDRAVRLSLHLFIFFIVIRVAGVQPFGDRFEKPVFPYSEPSHFAVVFAPLLLYAVARARGAAVMMWLGFAGIAALLLQSLTLIAAFAVAALVGRRFFLVALGGAVMVLGVVPLDLQYFLERLDFSGDTRNLSALVYIMGWQLIGESLGITSGWGLGFQQLGISGTSSEAAQSVYSLAGEYLNLQDGSFVLAKLTSEFGVFGLLFGLGYCVLALHCLIALRRRMDGAAVTFARCIIVAYAIEMLLRGLGYFTGTTLWTVAAVGLLAFKQEFTQRGLETLRSLRAITRSRAGVR